MVKPNTRSPSLTSHESYSAVIIADLVAEVPVAPEPEEESSKRKIEENNLAYDDHLDKEAKSPADIESKKNGGGIAKGVILNAVQFGQSDSKKKWDEKSLPLPDIPVPSTPKGFKDMSLTRKVAFGFSFLPSILFVLCFAIILPCNIPLKDLCVQQLWVTPFNDTELTSSMQVSEDLIFTFSGKGKYSLLALDVNNGSVLHEEEIASKPIDLRCSSEASAERICIVLDEMGTLYAINASNGKLAWTRNISEDVQNSSLPVFLPDCNNDGVDEIAVAVSNKEIQVIYNESSPSSFSILNCDSTPETLTAWIAENSSDLIFFCKTNDEDALMQVSQDVWCKGKYPDTPVSEIEAVTLFSRIPEANAPKYILDQVEDGLIVWFGEEVFLLQPNNSQKWNASSATHSKENRFILHGKFSSENMEIALFSSDQASNLKVTILDLKNGKKIIDKSYPDYGVTEGRTIRRKERDFVLLLLKKIKNDLKTEALTHISNISSNILSFISKEDMNINIANDLLEEIVLLDLAGNFSFHSIKEKDAGFKSAVTADFNEDILNVYLLTSLKGKNITEVSKIKVTNLDASDSKLFQCPAK